MTKYREVLWENEPLENPFAVGDRVIIFGLSSTGDPEPVVDEIIDFNPNGMMAISSGFLIHHRQCRKLEPVKAREWWIQRSLVDEYSEVVAHYEVHSEVTAKLAADEYNHGDEIIKVREVLEDE